MKESLKNDRARIQVGRISHFGLMEMSRQRIRSSVLESSTDKCPHCGGTGHVRSVSSVALHLLRMLEEMLLKGATHNLIVRTRSEVALYVLNHKRAHLRELESRFQIAITVNADATVGAAQPFLIEKGEQVHSLEAAKAIAAQSTPASPAVEDDEPEIEDDDRRRRDRRRRARRSRDRRVATSPATTEARGDDQPRRGRRRAADAVAAIASRVQAGNSRANAKAGDSSRTRARPSRRSRLKAMTAKRSPPSGHREPRPEGDANGDGERRRRRRGRRGGRRNRRGSRRRNACRAEGAVEPVESEVVEAVADFGGGCRPSRDIGSLRTAGHANGPQPAARTGSRSCGSCSVARAGSGRAAAPPLHRARARAGLQRGRAGPISPSPAAGSRTASRRPNRAEAGAEPAATQPAKPRRFGWWNKRS